MESIASAVFTAFCAVMSGLIGAFPLADPAVLDQVTDAGKTLAGITGAVNDAFPVVEFFAAVGIYLGFVVILGGFEVVRRVWSTLWPGSGS